MKNESGFTLIEATIAMALIGIAAVGFMKVNENIVKTEARMMSVLEFNNTSSLIRQELSKKENCNMLLKYAFSSTTSGSSSGTTSGSSSGTTSGSTNNFGGISSSIVSQLADDPTNHETMNISLAKLKNGQTFKTLRRQNNADGSFGDILLSTTNTDGVYENSSMLKATRLQVKIHEDEQGLSNSDILAGTNQQPIGVPIKVDFIYDLERKGKFKFKKTAKQTLLIKVNEIPDAISGTIKSAECIASDANVFEDIMPQVCEALNNNKVYNSSTKKCEDLIIAQEQPNSNSGCPCDSITDPLEKEVCISSNVATCSNLAPSTDTIQGNLDSTPQVDTDRIEEARRRFGN